MTATIEGHRAFVATGLSALPFVQNIVDATADDDRPLTWFDAAWSQLDYDLVELRDCMGFCCADGTPAIGDEAAARLLRMLSTCAAMLERLGEAGVRFNANGTQVIA